MTLAGGVFVFWLIAWVLTGGGANGLRPDVLAGSLALVVWAAVALPALAGALYFRTRAAEPLLPGSAEEGRGEGREAGRAGGSAEDGAEEAGGSASRSAQTHTIVAHALLEGPALLGGIFFLLLGTTPVVWVALPVYVLGLALTWPRAEWFTDARA